jgi:hypothetical protein
MKFLLDLQFPSSHANFQMLRKILTYPGPHSQIEKARFYPQILSI